MIHSVVDVPTDPSMSGGTKTNQAAARTATISLSGVPSTLVRQQNRGFPCLRGCRSCPENIVEIKSGRGKGTEIQHSLAGFRTIALTELGGRLTDW
jgi:hypothetical protein